MGFCAWGILEFVSFVHCIVHICDAIVSVVGLSDNILVCDAQHFSGNRMVMVNDKGQLNINTNMKMMVNSLR